MDFDDEVTADKIIKREHGLIKKGIPERQVHKILRNEFDDEEDENINEDNLYMNNDYKFKMTNDYYDKPIRMPDFDFSFGSPRTVKKKKTRDVIKKGVKVFGGVNY
ncbi:MAG TPA: hypothetical protein HA319_04570 [Nitrosopumilaceae archaeon]|nr:hypothetical protein [Nitrosopumilaceae archaeon]